MLRVAYQGISGAYTHEALLKFFEKLGVEVEAVHVDSTFYEVFQTAINETDLAFIPIENSNAGSVIENFDHLMKYDFEIIGEFALPINHCFLAKKGVKIEDIKEVYSHPQALAQCSDFLDSRGLIKHDLDTAASAKLVSENSRNDLGSLASEICADLYGLEILKRGFQNSSDNVTRFFLIKKKGLKFDFEEKFEKADKVSLIVRTKDIPAALYKCLGAFATQDINLTKIESRPSREKNFDYSFFIDFEGNLDDENVKLALEELEFFSKKNKILGNYKKFDF